VKVNSGNQSRGIDRLRIRISTVSPTLNRLLFSIHLIIFYFTIESFYAGILREHPLLLDQWGSSIRAEQKVEQVEVRGGFKKRVGAAEPDLIEILSQV